MMQPIEEPFIFRKLLQLSKLAYRHAKPKIILILLSIVVLFNVFLFPHFVNIATPTGTPSILDARFGFSAGEAWSTLDAFGENGRSAYLFMVAVIDSIYPLVYGLLLILTASFFLNKGLSGNSPFRVLNIMAIDAMLFDYAENFSIIWLLTKFPERADGMARMASVFGIIKWLVVFGCLLLIAVGIAAWISSSIRKRKPEAG
jgi:hypothetical protein